MIFWISSLSMPGKCPAPCGLASSSAQAGTLSSWKRSCSISCRSIRGPRSRTSRSDTVQGVLAARMDLLPASEKRVLQTASVVGRTFWNGAVASILDGEDRPQDLDDILWRLEDRGLVHARIGSTIVGEREFSFRHILTQEVAYESLPRRERATAHDRVAGWIGDRPPSASASSPNCSRIITRGLPWGPRNVPGSDRQGATEETRVPPRDARANEARRKLALEQAERFAATAVGCRGNTRARGRARGARHDVLP